MSIFLYQAKKNSGELAEGQLEAANKQEALAKIDAMGFFPLSLEEKKSSRKEGKKVSIKEITEFTHHLSTLINAGLPLLPSLNSILSEMPLGSLKSIVMDVVSHVKGGEDFSTALERYSHIFPKLYTSLVKIGETSGTLGVNLKRIAVFLEEGLEFKSNIFSILIYPSIVVGVGVMTICLLLGFVIPQLVGIFEETGQILPLPTLILIKISDIFSQYWFFLFGFIVVFIMIGQRSLKKAPNRLKLDRLKLDLPLVGELFKKIEVCRFSRTLAVLLRNGVSIEASLKVIVATIPNLFFQKEVARIGERIKDGLALSEAFKKVRIFSPSFINVIKVGEKSGTLDEILESISEDYNKEINRKIKDVLAFLGPVLILIVGMLVVFVMLAMLLPIFDMDFNF